MTPKPKPMHNPIIVALDVESAAAARALIHRIGPRVNFYKVGLELYTAAGMDFVRGLLADGQCFTPAQIHKSFREQDPAFDVNVFFPSPLRVLSAEKKAKKGAVTRSVGE
jgi:hypothetical protein